MAIVPRDVTDPTQLTPEQQIALLEEEAKITLSGIDYRPRRLVIEPRFRKFTDAATEDAVESIEGVVIFSQKVRGFWVEGTRAPICSSTDARHGVVSPEGQEQLNWTQMECAKCPLNRFGSNPMKGNDNWCKEMRRLFIVGQDDSLPFLLTLPPTSIGNFDSYASALVANKKAPGLLFHVTKIELEPAESNGFKYAKAKFSRSDGVDMGTVLQLRQMRDKVVKVAQELDVEGDEYYGRDAQATTVNEDSEPTDNDVPPPTDEPPNAEVWDPQAPESHPRGHRSRGNAAQGRIFSKDNDDKIPF